MAPNTRALGASGDTNTPGLINTVGGVSAGLDPPADPALEYLLFSVSFQAVKAGTFTFVPQLLSGSNYALYPVAVFPVAQVDPSQVSLVSDSIDITDPINHAPSGASKTVTTLEDTGYTFAAADFGFTDPNDTPPNSLLAVKITTLPAAGRLTDNGSSVTAGQFVSVADINSGKLVFTPAANANGTGCDSFTFQVQDNGGTAYGGVDLDPTPKTMTFNVTPVNDAAGVGWNRNGGDWLHGERSGHADHLDDHRQRRGQRESGRGDRPDHRQLPARAGRVVVRQHGHDHGDLERGHRDADLDRQRHGGQLPGGVAGGEVPEHQRQPQRGHADGELQGERRRGWTATC